MLETFKMSGWLRFLIWSAIALVCCSTVLTGIYTFTETVSDQEFCQDRQERVERAREAFVRTQDPLINASRREFEKESHTAEEIKAYEQRIADFRDEQQELAQELYLPVVCD